MFLMLTSSVLTNTSLVRSISGYPGRANGLITFASIFILTWICASTVLPEGFYQRLKNSVMTIFVMFSGYSLLQLFNLDPVPWNNPYNRIIGTLGNPNFSGAFLGVAAAVVLMSAFGSKGKNRWLQLIFSALLLGLAIATGSLQAFGIFVIGVAIQVLVFAYQHLRSKMFVALSMTMGFLATLTFLGFLGFGPLGQALVQGTLRLRLEYWRVGLEAAYNFPITGMGPDSYVEGFRLFRSADFVGEFSHLVIADSAHNVLINFMANFGIPAFLGLFVIVIWITVNSIKVLFRANTAEIIVKMLAMSWILLLIQSLFSLEQIGLNVFQWCCGALLLNKQIYSMDMPAKLGGGPSQKSRVSPLESLRTEIALLSIVFAMIASWGFMRQEIALQKMASSAEGTRFAEQDIEARLEVFNSYAKDEIRRAIYIADFLIRIQRYDQAQSLLEELIKKDVDAYEALEQLALLARFKENPALEIQYRKKIERIDPMNYENMLSIAKASSELGDVREARRYSRKATRISRDPLVNESATALLNARD
jgi:hypothetical protein